MLPDLLTRQKPPSLLRQSTERPSHFPHLRNSHADHDVAAEGDGEDERFYAESGSVGETEVDGRGVGEGDGAERSAGRKAGGGADDPVALGGWCRGRGDVFAEEEGGGGSLVCEEASVEFARREGKETHDGGAERVTDQDESVAVVLLECGLDFGKERTELGTAKQIALVENEGPRNAATHLSSLRAAARIPACARNTSGSPSGASEGSSTSSKLASRSVLISASDCVPLTTQTTSRLTSSLRR